MAPLCTRRSFLPLLAAPLAAQSAAPSPEWRRYSDPATEFEVLLLTDPQYESRYPSPPALAVDRRSATLLYASLRTGSWQPRVMDLRAGVSRQLGLHDGLVPETLTFAPSGREAIFAAGNRLLAVQMPGGRQRLLLELPAGAEWASSVAPSADGTALFYAVRQGRQWRLERLSLARGAAAVVATAEEPMLAPAPNPRRAMVFWLSPAGALEACALDGTQRRRLETPPGRVLEAHWAPDGQSLLYLHESEDAPPRSTIREQMLDSREDRLIAPTTQFVRFSRNANASVFLGASRSLASPLILVLLRINRREFSLCEHRASDPSITAPIFTADSQRILFLSDRMGKPAIFLMNVEKLIEKTGS